MTEKRFFIFISSTYEDLKQEREAVQTEVISCGDFPVLREAFPATNEEQFKFIKTRIDKCDHYILIIAARYGSVGRDGISYTEMEYNYAISKNIPVLVMLHGNRENIPNKNIEKSQESRAKLEKFIAEARKSRIVKDWKTTDALKLAVRQALDHAKETKPRVGWVRGDTIASAAALEELNEVRKENSKFRDAMGSMAVLSALPPIPDPNDRISIPLFRNAK